MLKSVWLIIKKECTRFIKDRRMLIMVVLFPALLTYGLYTLMGKSTANMTTVPENHVFRCYVQNAPQSFDEVFKAMNSRVIPADDLEEAKRVITDQEADLLVIFPADFDEVFLKKDAAVPNIQVYCNSNSATSRVAYTTFTVALEEMETSIVNVLDVNRGVEEFDLAEDVNTMFYFMPMLILMLLCNSCASFAPESIAGEKERGTFATMLVTPVSRTAIAVGKIVSLSLFATFAGLINFACVMLGLKNMMTGEMADMIPHYTAKEYLLLMGLIVTTVLVTVTLISIISAFAKSVKEASGSSLMITGFASIAGFASRLPISGLGWRCVPILNTGLGLNDLLMMDYAVTDIAVSCGCNLVAMAILMVVLSKMFNSEKIMFN